MKRISYQLTVWTPIQREPALVTLPARLRTLFEKLSFGTVVLFPRSRKLPESEESWRVALEKWSPYNGAEVTFSVSHRGGAARGRVCLVAPAYESIVPVSTFELDFSLAPTFEKSVFEDAAAVARATLVVAKELEALHGQVLATDSSSERTAAVYQRLQERGALSGPVSVEWVTAIRQRDQIVASALSRAAEVAAGSTILTHSGFEALLLTHQAFTYGRSDHLSLVSEAESAFGFSAA